MESATRVSAVSLLFVVTSSAASCISKQDLGNTPSTSDAAAPSCPEALCPATEVCHQGACRPRSTGGTCSSERLREGIDECPVDAMCLPGPNETAYCKLLEPCGPKNSCATGAQGAVCNTGYVAEKAHVCLYGHCVEQTNCPQGSKCLTTIGAVGFCSNGDPGSPCVTNDDCKRGSCMSLGAGFGICF